MKTKKKPSPPLLDLLRRARKSLPKVIDVDHPFLRAYCVANPGAHCAVFAVPPCDMSPFLTKSHPFVMVQNESAEKVVAGDWCELAYVFTPTRASFRVISILK